MKIINKKIKYYNKLNLDLWKMKKKIYIYIYILKNEKKININHQLFYILNNKYIYLNIKTKNKKKSIVNIKKLLKNSLTNKEFLLIKNNNLNIEPQLNEDIFFKNNSKKIFNYYYINLKKNDVKNLRLRIKNNNFLNEKLLFLETKIFMILFRSNWIANIYNIKNYINQEILLCNNNKINNYNMNIKMYDIIYIKKEFIKLIKNNLIKEYYKYNINFIKNTLNGFIIDYKLYILFYNKNIYNNNIENYFDFYNNKIDFLRFLDIY